MNFPGPELLGRLLNEHAAALALFARQWCSCPEDVVQEAFMRLAAEREAPANPAAWLFTVVRNGAISAGRAESRRRKHEASAAHQTAEWFEADAADSIDAQRRRQRPKPAVAGGAGSNYRPRVGRFDVCGNRPAGERIDQFGSPPISGRFASIAQSTR